MTKANTATIYFICGFIGSGKTTYAKQLAQTRPAYRFSLDEWMIPLYGEHMERDVFDARIATLEGLFKQAALEMLALGVSVIFDFGFWKRCDRQSINAWAKQHHLHAEMLYLDVDYTECCRRARQRNAIRGQEAYEMTPDMLELFWSWFEEPSANEALTRIIPS